MEASYVYTTSCVNSTYELITEMVEQAKEVSIATIKKHCQGFREWTANMGYESDKRRGLTIERDYHVSYYKSAYNGMPCYYVRHSGIEYIWVKPN